MSTSTTNLQFPYIKPTDYFVSDTFNTILDDIDLKVIGKSHLTSGAHWELWEEAHTYALGDIVRVPALKSNQYLECVQHGTSGAVEPKVNVEGTTFTDGTAQWIVRVLGAASENTISHWSGGIAYTKGNLVLYNNKLYRCLRNHTSVSFSADYSNWLEICASVNMWIADRFFAKDDTVVYNNVIYVCLEDNQDSIFTESHWQMLNADVYLPEWKPNTPYTKGQCVSYLGKMYRATATHTSAEEFDISSWEPILDYLPEWATETQYYENDIVQYKNNIYKCKTEHKSEATFTVDTWTLMHTPNAYIREWSTTTQYYSTQVVAYKGAVFRCNTATATFGTFESTEWDLISGIMEWASGIRYTLGNQVIHSHKLYQCISSNSDTEFNPVNWQVLGGGTLEDWESNHLYTAGNVVIYANKIYQCLTGHTSTESFVDDVDNWNEISANVVHIDDWKADTEYKIGDLVANSAKIYRCMTAHTSDAEFSETNWEELSPTINEISAWKKGTAYVKDNLVIYNSKLYRCKVANTASADFNGDIDNWELIGGDADTGDWVANTLYRKDQMVIYNNSLYRAKSQHFSSANFNGDFDKWEIVYSSIKAYNSSADYLKDSVVVQDNHLYKALKDIVGSGLDINAQLIDTVADAIISLSYSTSNPTSYVYTFETPTYVDSIKFAVSNFNSYISKWSVYTSVDGETYTLAYTSSDHVGSGTCTAKIGKTVSNLRVQLDSVNLGTYSGSLDVSNLRIYNASAEDWELLYDDITTIDLWVASTDYKVGNCVVNDGSLYRCIEAHTSGKKFDKNLWQTLSGSVLVLTPWTPSTEYKVGSIVSYDGGLYSCTKEHTSLATFTLDGADWQPMKSGILDWSTESVYIVDTVVMHQNQIYRCLTSHTSSLNFVDDRANWAEVSQSIRVWTGNTDYLKDDFVCFNNNLYICLIAHTSSEGFKTDTSYWRLLHTITDWVDNTTYLVGALVTVNGLIYRCDILHTSGDEFQAKYWTQLTKGIMDWQANYVYAVNDVIYRPQDGLLQRCITAHTSEDDYHDGSEYTYWQTISGTLPEYDTEIMVSGPQYKKGDIVVYKNKLYRAKSFMQGNIYPTDTSYWDRLDKDASSVDNWTANTEYAAGQLVWANNRLYKVTADVTPTGDIKNYGNYVSAISSTITKFASDVYYSAGDIVHSPDRSTNELFFCITSHTSTSWGATEKVYWAQISTYDSVIREFVENDKRYITLGTLMTYKNYIWRYTKESTTYNYGYTAPPLEYWAPIIRLDNGEFTVGYYYKENDVVRYNSVEYRASKAIAYPSSFSVGDGWVPIDYWTSTWMPYDENIATWLNFEPGTYKLLGTSSIKDSFGYKWSVSTASVSPSIEIKEENDIKYVYSTNTYLSYSGISSSSDATIEFKIRGTIGKIRVSGATVISKGTTFSEWTQITMTYTAATNKIYIWKDGVPYTSGTVGGGSAIEISSPFEITDIAIFSCDKYTDKTATLTYDTKMVGYRKNTYSLLSTCVYKDVLYKCITEDADTEFDATKWQKISTLGGSGGGSSISEWEASTDYVVGNLVLYNNKLYKCSTKHTSEATFDVAMWTFISANIEEWTANRQYKAGAVVMYNDQIYKSNIDQSSATFIPAATQILNSSFEWVVSMGATVTTKSFTFGSGYHITYISYTYDVVDATFYYLIVELLDASSNVLVTHKIVSGNTVNPNLVSYVVYGIRLKSVGVVFTSTSGKITLKRFSILGYPHTWQQFNEPTTVTSDDIGSLF